MNDEAYRVCPTCGTPAYAHPDRQAGEDELVIPDDVARRGVDALRDGLGSYSLPRDVAYEIVVAVFKAMAREA